MSTTILPVADGPAMWGYVKTLARRYPRLLGGAVLLHGLAAVAALAQRPDCSAIWSRAVEQGTTTAYVDRVIALLAGFLIIETVLTRYARYVSQVLGERVLAELREDFVGNALALPVGVVESAGSGDLRLTRTSRDVEQLGWSVRWALPEWTIAVITAILTFAAALSVGWWGGPDPVRARRAAAGHRVALVPRPSQGRLPTRKRVVLGHQRDADRDRRGRPQCGGTRPRRRRIDSLDRDIKESFDAERYTLSCADGVLPNMEIAYLIPTVCTLLFSAATSTRRARSRSATSPPRRCTCRC